MLRLQGNECMFLKIQLRLLMIVACFFPLLHAMCAVYQGAHTQTLSVLHHLFKAQIQLWLTEAIVCFFQYTTGNIISLTETKLQWKLGSHWLLPVLQFAVRLEAWHCLLSPEHRNVQARITQTVNKSWTYGPATAVLFESSALARFGWKCEVLIKQLIPTCLPDKQIYIVYKYLFTHKNCIQTPWMSF